MTIFRHNILQVYPVDLGGHIQKTLNPGYGDNEIHVATSQILYSLQTLFDLK